MSDTSPALPVQVEVSQSIMDGFNALGIAGRRQAGTYAVLLLGTLGKPEWLPYARQGVLDLTAAVEDHTSQAGFSQEATGRLNAARSGILN